jgi:hypothetical protein
MSGEGGSRREESRLSCAPAIGLAQMICFKLSTTSTTARIIAAKNVVRASVS